MDQLQKPLETLTVWREVAGPGASKCKVSKCKGTGRMGLFNPTRSRIWKEIGRFLHWSCCLRQSLRKCTTGSSEA